MPSKRSSKERSSSVTRRRERRARKCPDTGFRIVPAKKQAVVRLAKPSYGPLNPPPRSLDGNPMAWGRFDVAGHRTIYVSDGQESAYSEILAYVIPSHSTLQRSIRDAFGGHTDTTLGEAIAKEWRERFAVDLNLVVRAFREDYHEYNLTLPTSGWFVDIEHADTLSALQRVRAETARSDEGRLTLGDIFGEDRNLTTALAGQIHQSVLFDGSLPHGIQFRSKHGTLGVCRAVWLRAIDDGKEQTSEPTKIVGPGAPIREPAANPALRRVADRFGVAIH